MGRLFTSASRTLLVILILLATTPLFVVSLVGWCASLVVRRILNVCVTLIKANQRIMSDAEAAEAFLDSIRTTART